MRPLSLPVLEVHQPFAVRSLPRRRPCVVVHVVDSSARVPANLPAVGQGSGTLPVRGPCDVVHVIPASVRVEADLPAGGQGLIVAARLRCLQLLIARVGDGRRIAGLLIAIWYLLLRVGDIGGDGCGREGGRWLWVIAGAAAALTTSRRHVVLKGERQRERGLVSRDSNG